MFIVNENVKASHVIFLYILSKIDTCMQYNTKKQGEWT